MSSTPSFRSPMGRVRGLGSAKQGTHHWWMQRVSAIALAFLGLWLLFSLIGLSGADHAAFVGWLRQPLAAVLLGLFVLAAFYHLKLGLQVIVEDYVHAEGSKLAALLAVNFAAIGLGALCLFSILRVAL
jgi:succinate dehydrogenase / fumarate reductase, membrane anchor subunit